MEEKCIIGSYEFLPVLRVMKEHSRLYTRIFALAFLLGAGFWLRSLDPEKFGLTAAWRPWARTTIVNLYFSDGRFLVPVSRAMPMNDDLPRATLQALLAGPKPGSGLKSSIPRGVEIRSLKIESGVTRVDLSAAILDGEDETAETAIIETMTALPGVNSIVLSADGKSFTSLARRKPLLYYASATGLAAVPVSATGPRAALELYLSGPTASDLAGLPSDIGFPVYEYNGRDGLLSLKFAYTPSIRTMAVEKPHRVRLVLLGLIASLTEFSEVRAVQLDFGGQTRLGLGQCSDLLRTPQARPQLLNDERLLD